MRPHLLDERVGRGGDLGRQRLQPAERGNARGGQRIQLLVQQQLEAGRAGKAACQAARVLVGRAVVPASQHFMTCARSTTGVQQVSREELLNKESKRLLRA